MVSTCTNFGTWQTKGAVCVYMYHNDGDDLRIFLVRQLTFYYRLISLRFWFFSLVPLLCPHFSHRLELSIYCFLSLLLFLLSVYSLTHCFEKSIDKWFIASRKWYFLFVRNMEQVIFFRSNQTIFEKEKKNLSFFIF